MKIFILIVRICQFMDWGDYYFMKEKTEDLHHLWEVKEKKKPQ